MLSTESNEDHHENWHVEVGHASIFGDDQTMFFFFFFSSREYDSDSDGDSSDDDVPLRAALIRSKPSLARSMAPAATDETI